MRFKAFVSVPLALAVLAGLAIMSAAAQNVTGAITGVVKDPSGAVIPSAPVAARNTATSAKFTATTDATGVYWLRTLPVGTYEVTVEAPGFQKWQTEGVRLQVNEILRIDASMAVGSTGETVTVASSVVAVDTNTATMRAVVDQKRIEELPLNGRNPTQLMLLVPGVVRGDTTNGLVSVLSGTAYPGAMQVSSNGQRANTTNYILDGAQHNDVYNNVPNPLPNPDALKEFSVQTNGFSAEFGRQAGAVVNAVTRSGSNDLHGSAFEYVRNQALNAANFFAPIVNGVKRQDGLKRNQFGATAGGPVWLPKLYNGKDKTFFFFSYQNTLLRRVPAQVQRVVATAAQKQGDFSALSKTIRDPLTGQPFAGNRIPQSRIEPISQTLLSYVPSPASGNTISTFAPNNQDDKQILVRGDHNLTASNRLSGRYFRSWAAQTRFANPENVIERNNGGSWYNHAVQITDTHMVSPTVVNQALFSFGKTDGEFVPVPPPKCLADLGVKMWNNPVCHYDIDIGGYFRLDTGDTNLFPRNEYQVLDTLRWNKGRHQISMGGEYGRGAQNIFNNTRSSGRWTFSAAGPFSGDGMSDFLLGKYTDLTQGYGEYKDNRFHRASLFVQDTWKVARRFTLDVGLRWEPFIPFTDLNGKLGAWRPGQRSQRYVNAPLGVNYPGDPDVPAGTFPIRKQNFAPRIGWAWDVTGDGRTAIRGGYGVFFDSLNAIATNSHATQAPFAPVVQIFGNPTNSLRDPYAGTSNPFPVSDNPPREASFPQFSSHMVNVGDLRNAYVQSWNLTVEREVKGGLIGRISYAGSKGTRLIVPRELNAAVYAPGVTTATTNQRRPYAPAMGATTVVESVGNSIYHALQLAADRRFSNGFTLMANYQWSKSIDDSSANKGAAVYRTDPFNQRFDRGVSDFHRAHVFNFSGLWDLPFKGSSRVSNLVFGGWSLNAIMMLSTGGPFQVLSNVDNARSGINLLLQRADVVGPWAFDGDRKRQQVITEYARRAAFAPNTLGTYGNQGRNPLTGPGLATVDTGASKKFAVNDRIGVTLRFEMFNSLNRVNLGQPNIQQNNVNFMRITAAGEPRILQLALRTTW